MFDVRRIQGSEMDRTHVATTTENGELRERMARADDYLYYDIYTSHSYYSTQRSCKYFHVEVVQYEQEVPGATEPNVRLKSRSAPIVDFRNIQLCSLAIMMYLMRQISCDLNP
jgi:hypothetical protein